MPNEIAAVPQEATTDLVFSQLWSNANHVIHAHRMDQIGNPIVSELFPDGELSRVSFDSGEKFLVIGQLKGSRHSNIVMSFDADRHAITVSTDFGLLTGRMVAKFFDRRYQVENRIMVSVSCKTCKKFSETLALLRK